MKLQKVEKLDKNVISSIKIYKHPFTSVIWFEFGLNTGKYEPEKTPNLDTYCGVWTSRIPPNRDRMKDVSAHVNVATKFINPFFTKEDIKMQFSGFIRRINLIHLLWKTIIFHSRAYFIKLSTDIKTLCEHFRYSKFFFIFPHLD